MNENSSPVQGLRDSHIEVRSEEERGALGGLDFEPPLKHDDGAWFSVISGPSAEAGADPGGVSERAFGMRVFLALGLAFEVSAIGFDEGDVLGFEDVGTGA